MDWFIKAMRNTFNFSDRARRKEYWMFALITFIFSLTIGVIELNSGMIETVNQYGPLSMLLALIFFLPSLSVAVRRLHDVGRSGWWLLLAFIPFVGFIVLFIFSVLDSEPGENKYGPNPKEEGKLAAQFQSVHNT